VWSVKTLSGLHPFPERDQEMPEDEEMPQEKSPGESSILNPGVKIYQQESWRIFNLQSWTEDSPRRVLENLQSSILDCSQALRGIRRCHRLRSLRRGRQLSESSLSPKSPRLNAQCAFKPALRGNPCSLKEQKKVCSSEGMWGIWNSSILRSGASSVA